MNKTQLYRLADLAGVTITESQLEISEGSIARIDESATKSSKKKEWHQASLERAIKSIKQAEGDVSAVFEGTDVGDDYEKLFKDLLGELDADLDDLKNRED